MMTGAEIKAFYRDWSDDKILAGDWFHDDGMMECDEETGQPILDNETEYDFDEQIGVLGWQGSGPMPGKVTVNGVHVRAIEAYGVDTEALINAWRGGAVMVCLRLEPDEITAFREVCAKHGWSPIE